MSDTEENQTGDGDVPAESEPQSQAEGNQNEEEKTNLKDVEKQEEAKLRAKYPNMKCPGSSVFLQKRLSKGTKYFDSGDYNMAKAKVGPGQKVVIGPGQKVAMPGPTGDAIPTPQTVPHKKIGLLQSKLANMS